MKEKKCPAARVRARRKKNSLFQVLDILSIVQVKLVVLFVSDVHMKQVNAKSLSHLEDISEEEQSEEEEERKNGNHIPVPAGELTTDVGCTVIAGL